MQDVTKPYRPAGVTSGEAASFDLEAQLKLAQAERCTEPLQAAKLAAEARGLQLQATDLRAPPAAGLPELLLGRGGEVSPLPDPRMPVMALEIADTIHSSPDMLTAEASANRLSLARDAGVLTEAVEAAESIGADGPIEMMLVHQITAGHRLGMQLMTAANTALQVSGHNRFTGGGDGSLKEATRTALACARLMDSTVRATLALDRLRNGGRQQVTVQHLVVADGGQAVVAGAIASGGLGKRRGRGRGPQ